MSVYDQTAFINGSYYSFIDSQWLKTGIVAPGFTSSEVIGNELVINYDSDYDILRNGLTPFLSFTDIDSDGVGITWTPTIVYGDGPGVGNDKFATVEIAGSSPQFSIVPSKETDEQYKTNIIRFETSAIPAFSMYDSDDQIAYNSESKITVDISFTYSSANIISDHPKGYSLVTIGSPLVNFFNNSVEVPFEQNEGLHFNNDGTKLFVNNANSVKQYDLTSPFDTLTMTNEQQYDPYMYGNYNLSDLCLNDSGNRLYLANKSGNKIHEFDVDTPFDITTALKRDNTLYEENLLKDTILVDAGSKLISKNSSNLTSYNLEENYNISTWNNTTTTNLTLTTYTYERKEIRYPTAYERQYSGVSYNLERFNSYFYRWVSRWNHIASPTSYCFSSNGSFVYWVTGIAAYDGKVYRQSLSTPFDINSVVGGATGSQSRSHTIGKSTSETFEVNGKNNGVQCIRISPDGTKLFLLDTYTHSIYQHVMTTAHDLTSIGSVIRNTSNTVDPNGGYDTQFYYTQIPNANASSSFYDTSNVRNFSFNNDGTKLYITNDTTVYEYNVTSAFDLSSVSYVTSYSLFSSDITVDGGIFISDSDQKLYAYGTDFIHQYDLDSNLSTATEPFKSKELTIAEDSQPTGMVFNNSGTTLYVGGSQTNNVFKYILSDKDKIYSATFDSAYSTPTLITDLQGIVTNSAEDKMFLLSNRTIAEIHIDSQFSASTDPGISYGTVKSNSINKGMRWNNDGSQFTVSGNSTLETYKTDNLYRVIPL